MKRRAFLLFSIFFLVAASPLVRVGILESASFSAWGGSSDPPEWVAEDGGYYRIAGAAQLAGMRDWINAGLSADKKFVLEADIDLCGIEWEPIGKSTNTPFRGQFDGGEHIIANLSIANLPAPSTSANHAGLFGQVGQLDSAATNGATLRNVRILSADIRVVQTGTQYALRAGVLAGGMSNSRAEDCHVQGGAISAEIGANMYVGGLFGQAVGENVGDASVERCIASVRLRTSTGAIAAIGGLIGEAENAAIAGNAAKADIHGIRSPSNTNRFSAGGLVGRLVKSTIRDSAAYGEIIAPDTTANSHTGGIAGYSKQTSGSDTVGTSASFVALSLGAATGGILGSREGANLAIQSCDWRYPNNGVEAGIGRDTATPRIDQLTHARSRDERAFRDESDFRSRGWDFDDVWCYTPLDRNAAPNLSFVFADAARATLRPDVLLSIPDQLAMVADELALVKIFSGVYETGNLQFDGADRLSDGGVTITRHPSSNDWFIVSADGYVKESARDIALSVRIGDAVQTKIFRIAVSGDLEISTGTLPGATRGTPYFAAIGTKNGRGPVTFTAHGKLPPGLGLAADTGFLYGTPTKAGTFDVEIAATDARHTVRRTFPLLVADADGAADGETGESLTNLLSALNASLDGAQIGVLQDIGGAGTPIAFLPPENLLLEVLSRADAGNNVIALADSFSISAVLNGGARGDCLAFAYTADLTKSEEFAGWAGLDEDARARRLADTGISAVYEYERAVRSAALIGGEGLCTWEEAIRAGCAVLTASGVSIRYAVTDGDGPPRLDGNVIVVPDGARNGWIKDPLWIVRASNEANEEEKISAGKESGCDAGVSGGMLAVLLLLFFFAGLHTFARRKKTS